MEAIEQLAHQYLLLKAGAGDMDACIDWAIERLRHDEEGDDLDIVLLAGATQANEAAPLVRQIVERYCSADIRDDELAAGKYVAHLRKSYLLGAETIASLELKLTRIYLRFDFPSWLSRLVRNCQHAIHSRAYEEPFEKEFAYVVGLWETATSRAEFESVYSRKVSRQHDAPNG